MTDIAIITEACIGTKDRACVDVCPVQCIYEFDPVNNMLVSEAEAGSGVIEGSHLPNADAVAIFGDGLAVRERRRVHVVYGVLPARCLSGRRYLFEERVPDGSPSSSYNSTDTSKGHDHTFFVQLTRDVFAD